jgi:hypothetical protein
VSQKKTIVYFEYFFTISYLLVFYLTFNLLLHCALRCPCIAANIPAALPSSGDFHKCSCWVQNFIYALPFPRGYCRYHAKHPVPVAQLGKNKQKNKENLMLCNGYAR